MTDKSWGFLFCSFFLIVGMVFCFCSSALADGFYVGASGAAVFAKAGEDMSLTMTNSKTGLIATNSYNADTTSEFGGAGGVTLGYQFRMSNDLEAAIGAAAYYFYLDEAKGIVHPLVNVNPNFPTLNYEYDLQSAAIMGEFRLIYHPYWSNSWQSYQPYLLFGAGVSRNETSSYKEVPTNPNRSAAPMWKPFSSEDKLQPAFEAGIGVQHMISENFAISLDYRFIWLGEGELGTTASGPTKPSSLKTGDIYANTFFLNLIYTFGVAQNN